MCLALVLVSSLSLVLPARAQRNDGAPPSGATIRVPADQPTIQAGIDAAADGDLVLVAPGVYTGPGNRDLGLRGKRITVQAAHGLQPVVVDCQASPADPHRAFFFHEGEDARTVVEGFTLINGFAGSLANRGGGVLCVGSSPTLRDCTLEGCGSVMGGAIACVDAAPVFLRCTLRANEASAGGALSLERSS